MKQTLLTICLIVFALPSWGDENSSTKDYSGFSSDFWDMLEKKKKKEEALHSIGITSSVATQEVNGEKNKASLERKHKITEETIFDNCVIKNLPDNPVNELKVSVIRKCFRIAENPNWWQKWWYSD